MTDNDQARARLRAARRTRSAEGKVCIPFDPREADHYDPVPDLDALGVAYAVAVMTDRRTGRAYFAAQLDDDAVAW
ncbi:MAG: hypothetical protein QOF00_5975 [Pseudonocardiales bacterium]|jgi:hypothetical protein|nr:hypothetical protein [Pseudonocardiales bacterium]